MSEIKYPIYLDSHATTPVDPRVFEEMKPYFTEIFGNASSLDHTVGYNASIAVQQSREKMQVQFGMNAAYDMYFCDRLAIIFFYNVQHLLNA